MTRLALFQSGRNKQRDESLMKNQGKKLNSFIGICINVNQDIKTLVEN